MTMHYVLAFESTHAAMAAQSAFQKAQASFALIPTPREISAGCGMSLKFPAESPEEARALVDRLVEPALQESSTLYAADGYQKLEM